MQSNIQQIVNRFETSNKRNLSEHNIISTLALFFVCEPRDLLGLIGLLENSIPQAWCQDQHSRDKVDAY